MSFEMAHLKYSGNMLSETVSQCAVSLSVRHVLLCYVSQYVMYISVSSITVCHIEWGTGPVTTYYVMSVP